MDFFGVLKMKFKAEVGKLLDIVVNSLYSEKQIFLRELVSNASDACDKLKYMALLDPTMGKLAKDFKISITPDAALGTLVIADNGIGMNRDDLVNHLGTIAKSGTADFVSNVKDNGSAVDLIGQFGVGFYAAFMVASKVEVLTKRAGEEQAYLWVSDGIGGFEIKEAKKEEHGTEIKLFLKDDAKDFADSIYLRNIIRTYSDHIGYPIVLNLGEFGEETVNTASALWTRNKADISAEQYKEFYHHVSGNFDEPWMSLHFKTEGNMEYTGLLYIPGQAPYDLFQPDRRQGLKLYVNKVFISDKVEDLLPNYLRFVRGVVDSSDLPLNISRETLQHNALIGKIKNGVVSRILKELKKRAENYDDYIKFWQLFGMALKEGIYEDPANREDIAGLARFYSTADLSKMVSMDEYVERAKDKIIYYVTGDDAKVLRNNPQLEAFKARGIEVLLLVDPIDEFWVQLMKDYKGAPIKHVAQAEIDFGVGRDGSRVDEDKLKVLMEKMGKILEGEVGRVGESLRLANSPVCLTVEKGQMSIHLERLMKNHQQKAMIASSRVLEVNPYHPLIMKLAELKDEAKVEEVSKMLLDQAKIAEGEAVGNPSFFAGKLSEYMLAQI